MQKDLISELRQKIKGILPIQKMKIISGPQIDDLKPDFALELYINDIKIKLIGEIIEKESYSVFRKRIHHLKLYEQQNLEYVPLLVARYLSPQKQQYCKENKINYLDLSGNVYLNYNNIYIEKSGFINKYPEIRKGRNPFADKASLVLRVMLESDKVWGVRELSQKTGLNPGFVSRMFKELEKQDYMSRRNGKGRINNKRDLLRDWVDFYDYKLNDARKYFCLSKGPEEIISKLDKRNIPQEIQYALSFHAGASLVSPYAAYEEVHLYASDQKAQDYFVEKMELKPVERGANLVILNPYYKNSVFFGKQRLENLWIVSDIQLYIDLSVYPKRGIEQAEHIYEKRLKEKIEGS